MNIYQLKIDISVHSKHQAVFDVFLKGFKRTTQKFEDIRLFVVHKNHEIPEDKNIISIKTDDYGGKVQNEILIRYTLKEQRDVFGYFNDDLWFVDGWLEDALNLLNTFQVSSCGYVETDQKSVFLNAVEITQDEGGAVNLPYMPAALINTTVFRRIGLFAEGMKAGPEDLDFVWRMCLNNVTSATAKSIKMAHSGTINKDPKWKDGRTDAKTLFYNRHGYQSYRDLLNLYKEHCYFKQFR